jgi:hypothetical protein
MVSNAFYAGCRAPDRGSLTRRKEQDQCCAPCLPAFVLMLLGHGPALADYASGKAHFNRMTPEQQTAITLALIATGDFESLAEFGYSRYLYQAIRRFEKREGYPADGVLEDDEIARLKALAENYYGKLGNRYYTHPETGARLLVPRKLFDEERDTEDGMLFTRADGMLSLSFVSFPDGPQELRGTLFDAQRLDARPAGDLQAPLPNPFRGDRLLHRPQILYLDGKDGRQHDGLHRLLER